jgi:hypothetical protein
MELVGVKPTALCNWRNVGSFPPRYMTIMMDRLAGRGLTARASLWRQVE